MLFFDLTRLIVLHAGTPVELSQATLMLMFVVLGLLLNGIGFGRVVKSKESLLYHRWILSATVVLTCLAIFLVMLPSAFRFYIDPDVMLFSNVSITTVIHGVVGVPAVATAVIYAFGDLPMKVRKWMRLTAILWITDIGLGVVLFLQMLELI
jgi:uncharacterized membrane protein YozB (DUF420 family)